MVGATAGRAERTSAEALVGCGYPPRAGVAQLVELGGKKIFWNQGRRFPAASIAHAFSIRRLWASDCLAESIHEIKSLRS